MRITEEDRIAARAERERTQSKMSEATKAKLRQQSEADKCDEVEEARVHAQFMKLRRDVPNFANALYQIVGPNEHIIRMARKLLAALDAGLVPTLRHASSDIMFLAALTPVEEQMTDEEFDKELRVHTNMRHRVSSAVRPKRGSLAEKQAQMRKRAIRINQPAENVLIAA